MRTKANAISMVLSRSFLAWPTILLLFCVLNITAQDNAGTAVVGTVEKVDAAAKTVSIKTADGSVQTVKFTEKTTVHGFNDVAKAADLTGKAGANVVVYTAKGTAKGADKTASAIVYAGKETGKAVKGTVVKVDDATKTVVVKTSEGTEEAFDVSGHAVIDSGEAVGSFSAKTVKAGDRVTVHYTTDAGKKVAHAFVHW
jgi:hypothetical protein